MILAQYVPVPNLSTTKLIYTNTNTNYTNLYEVHVFTCHILKNIG